MRTHNTKAHAHAPVVERVDTRVRTHTRVHAHGHAHANARFSIHTAKQDSEVARRCGPGEYSPRGPAPQVDDKPQDVWQTEPTFRPCHERHEHLDVGPWWRQYRPRGTRGLRGGGAGKPEHDKRVSHNAIEQKHGPSLTTDLYLATFRAMLTASADGQSEIGGWHQKSLG